MLDLNESDQHIAESYGVCTENDAILIEDSSVRGYGIASAIHGLNFDEATLVMEQIAKLHAIHAVLQEKNPKEFENFNYDKE